MALSAVAKESVARSIPFHRPAIGDDEVSAVVECLRSGWLTTGPRVQAFQKLFAEYIGAKHAIAVNSGTAAMHLALAGLGIKSGDKVITSTYTFVATAEAILYLGAKPVLVDIDGRTGNIDPDGVKKAITEKTRAILPVHLGGYSCDMKKLQDIARIHNLHLVDDAAHALESTTPEGKIGRLGDATCFSFYATKNITTGEGGMVTCRDDDLADRILNLSLHGMSRDAWKRYSNTGSWYYEVIACGYKYNMPDIAAAIGIAQLKKVNRLWQRRWEIAEQYHAAFEGMPEIETPPDGRDSKHAWHLYLLRLNLERLRINRATFIERLKERGVHCSVHFIPLHLMPYFRKEFGYHPGNFPNAESMYERVISLPIFPAMADDEVAYVIAAIKDVLMRL